MTRWLSALAALFCAACSPASEQNGGPGGPDAGSEIAAPAPPDGDGCERYVPGSADHRVVVSLPYDSSGAKANAWRSYSLDEAAQLAARSQDFAMGRAINGTVRFTSDGAIGFVAQEDGSVGVFRFVPGGVEVVHAGYAGDFYAEDVIVADDDSSLLIVDANWRNNGGGIYRVSVACDGALGATAELVAPSKSARGWRFREDGSAIVSAVDIADSTTGRDMHVVSFSDEGALVVDASFDAFADDEAIVTDLELAGGQQLAIVADTNGFSEVAGNRIAVVSTVTGVTQVESIEDPYDIIVSPFDNAVVVVSGFGEALYASRLDAAADEPLERIYEVDYVDNPPVLPGRGAVIEGGALAGVVVIAENGGIRTLRFGVDGSVTDLGLFRFPPTLDNVVGAIGITP